MESAILNKIKNHEPNILDTFIIVVILFTGIILGLETNKEFYTKYYDVLQVIDIVVILIFLAEFIIRVIAEERQPLNYFRDGWNIFDFTILVLLILPYFSHNLTEGFQAIVALRIARLFRTLRVFRLFRLIPRLRPFQVIFETLMKSLPTMFYVLFLLVLMFYIYAIIGYFLFNKYDTIHFASLGACVRTLYETMTGNWFAIIDVIITEMSKQGALTWEYWLPYLYFLTFYILSGLIIINFFIGIVVTELSSTQLIMQKEELKDNLKNDLDSEAQQTINSLSQKLDDAHAELRKLMMLLDKKEG